MIPGQIKCFKSNPIKSNLPNQMLRSNYRINEYGDLLKSENRKIRTRKKPYLDTFHAVTFSNNQQLVNLSSNHSSKNDFGLIFFYYIMFIFTLCSLPFFVRQLEIYGSAKSLPEVFYKKSLKFCKIHRKTDA